MGVKDINIKNRTYYFLNDIIDIKDYGQNHIKIDEKPYINILIYCTAYITIKNSKYLIINSENPLYIMFNKMNGYFEEIYGNKYLTLVSKYESKEKIKEYEELPHFIRDLTLFVMGIFDLRGNWWGRKGVVFAPPPLCSLD